MTTINFNKEFFNTSSIECYITNIFEHIFSKLSLEKKYAVVQTSSRPDLGQFQCNGAMSLAKIKKEKPMTLAKSIIDLCNYDNIFSDISLVSPGFINITLKDNFLSDWLNFMFQDERMKCFKVSKPKKVIIDFGGPNIAKPLHVGHLRSALLGDSLQRIYKFCGDSVISDIHLGDWGTQMGILISALRNIEPNLPYFNKNFLGLYPEESPVTIDQLSELYPRSVVLCKNDVVEMQKARQAIFELQRGNRGFLALWNHFRNISIRELKKDYSELGVTFDLWKGESDVKEIVESMIEKSIKDGLATESEGAVVVFFDKKDSSIPLILRKSDKAITYATTDLATIQDRISCFNPQKIIYVVDQRQSLHFKQVFCAARKLKIIENHNIELIHVGFGTINGKDGKPFKTRSGKVMKLSSLIDKTKEKVDASFLNEKKLDNKLVTKVALATLKFADLSNLHTSDYIFDLDKFSKYDGKTGPYLLYTVVRIKSIFRKLKDYDYILKILPSEDGIDRSLQLILSKLSKAIEMAYKRHEPFYLCEHAYAVASQFNKFYANVNIINESDLQLKNHRITICKFTLKQLILVLNLLGIEVPEKM